MSQVWAQVRGAEERVWTLRFSLTPLRGEPRQRGVHPWGPAGLPTVRLTHVSPQDLSLPPGHSLVSQPNGAGRQDRCWGSEGTRSVYETAQSAMGCVHRCCHPRASAPAPPTHRPHTGPAHVGRCPGDREEAKGVPRGEQVSTVGAKQRGRFQAGRAIHLKLKKKYRASQSVCREQGLAMQHGTQQEPAEEAVLGPSTELMDSCTQLTSTGRDPTPPGPRNTAARDTHPVLISRSRRSREQDKQSRSQCCDEPPSRTRNGHDFTQSGVARDRAGQQRRPYSLVLAGLSWALSTTEGHDAWAPVSCLVHTPQLSF